MRQNGVERFEMMQSTARGWCVLSRASAYPRLNRSSGPFENAGCVRGQDKAIRSNETPPALFKIKNLQDGDRGGGFSGEREREREREEEEEGDGEMERWREERSRDGEMERWGLALTTLAAV